MSAEEAGGKGGKGRKAVAVVNSRGTRSRFLRGMITHDLVQRGLDFDRAYAIAQAIRDRVSDRDEVSTAELLELIREELERYLGPELPPNLAEPPEPVPEFHVLYHGQRQLFSRALLAGSIHAAGVEIDRAYDLVSQIAGRLREEGVAEIASEDLVRRVSDRLEADEGSQVARRYRLVRRIKRLPRPLVIYIGGASGTGKSTLALELAPLLRIYRITATDTIRQVMRMIFSPAVLPALHGSSFEVPPDPLALPLPERLLGQLPAGYDPRQAERLLGSFEEQVARVLVGVRAVVERAIAENMSIVVEGVHLCPPLVPFKDLEGAVYQVPLMLATLDHESHRSRFLARARTSGRGGQRYLENFHAIRTIHDFLLQQAETHDLPLIDTSAGGSPVGETLRLVTEILGGKLPPTAHEVVRTPRELPPTLLLVIDGLADRPVRELGGRTPLQAAKTPHLDRLAREGQTGLADPIAPGVVPDTASGTLALFGQSPVAMKRGPVEALGAGFELGSREVAMRGNFATLDAEGNVVDRRAGRVRDEGPELAAALDRMPLPGGLADEVEVRVRVTTEHRLAVVMSGDALSSAIDGSDPGEGAIPGPPLIPRPKDPDNERAVHTARALSFFEQEARRILAEHPANARREAAGRPAASAVITRGAGRLHRLIPLEEAGLPLRITCVAADRTVLGLAAWLGARTVTLDGMTASLDTDVAGKFRAAEEALSGCDLVILHLKGADIAAHDQRPDLKVSFLESIDRELGRLLERHSEPLRVAVGSDHATVSESGQHAADPLPVLIWGDGIEADSTTAFDERSTARGRLQRFPLQMLLARFYDLR